MTNFERSLPPLSTLVAFEAAYRHNSFTRAAEELHRSQASVSRRIRELEADLGIQLFDRHRYNVTPTPEGVAFASAVRLALAELSAAADRVRRQASTTSSFTVLSSLSLASVMVAPALSALQRKHPHLTVRLRTACEPIETSQEEFDVAVQYGSSESDRFDVEFITHEAIFPVCAPSLARSLPASISPSELTKLSLLHVDDDPSWTTWAEFLSAAGSQAPAPEQSHVFGSYHVCLDVAEQGEGIALGWERSVRPRLEAGTLTRLAGLTLENAACINTYAPKHLAGSSHIADFIDLVQLNGSV